MSFDTFLIVGGNFNNKGAEAMMYIAICEIRRRFPQAEIYTLVGNAKLEEKKHSNLRTVLEIVSLLKAKKRIIRFLVRFHLSFFGLQDGAQFACYAYFSHL